ncbi:MAG: hypothetical protein JNM38_07530 [Acidobacteria bacterium]|nr:hypothetical protein [Acidobacteriota bacterium]
MGRRLTEVYMYAHAFSSRPAMGLVALALLAGSTALPVAQERQVPAAPQVFRSGVELITSDVTVLSRDGTSVGDLSVADFRVTVDGTPRRIATLKYVRAHESSPSPGAPVAPAAGGADAPSRWIVTAFRKAPAVRSSMPRCDSSTRSGRRIAWGCGRCRSPRRSTIANTSSASC